MNRDAVSAQKKILPGIYRKYNLDVESRSALLASAAGSGIVTGVLDELFGTGLSGSTLIGFIGLVAEALFISGYLAYEKRRRTEPVEPYKYKKGGYFVGLILPGKEDLNGKKGWVQRRAERGYICSEIRKRAFSDDRCKPAICLTGESGSGKSVMLEFITQDLKKEFETVNYTDRYSCIAESAEEAKRNLKLQYDESVRQKKGLLIIFDQFERCLSMPPEDKVEIHSLLAQCANLEKTAVIFGVRKDVLMDMLDEINLSSVGSSGEKMKIVCVASYAQRCKEFREEEKNFPSDGEPSGLVICLDNGKESDPESVEHEIMDNCINAELTYIAALKNDGKTLYNEVRDLSLIEQQIVLNIYENEKDHETVVENLKGTGINDKMTCYYDRQLCSTGNYYDASRIMYLLSVARMNSVSMMAQNVYDALCATGEDDDNKLRDVIEKLKELYLISEKDKLLEVSHDYVAKSFEEYALKEMSSDVRTAIDYYVIRFAERAGLRHDENRAAGKDNDDGGGLQREANRLYRDEWKKGSWITAWAVFIILITVIWTAAALVFRVNASLAAALLPAHTVQISLFVPILAVLSVLYVYNYYRNIIRFCLCRKALLKLLYIIEGMCGAAAVILDTFCGRYWMALLGAGTALIGVSSLIIRSVPGIPPHGRKLYFAYGIRTSVMGVFFALGSLIVDIAVGQHVVVIPGGPEFDIIQTLETGVMAALVAYSYLTHMRKDYFYYFTAALMEMKTK